MSDLNAVFEALSNEHRREIMLGLAVQPRSISQLAAMRNLSLPAIHKHVRVLEGAAMVHRKKVGRTNFLSLARDPLAALHTWIDQFDPWWGTDEESLKNYADYLRKQQDNEAEAQ